MRGTNGTLQATLAALLVLSATLMVPLSGATGTATLPEPGTPGEVSSAEDDEDAVFDLEFRVGLADNAPGVVDGQHTITAQGLTENITLHYIGIRSEAFDYSNCSPDKTTALGIDRGNDDEGTFTDKSVLSSYQQFIYEEDSIVLSFYKEETLAGEPVDAYVTDQLVARQSNCIDNPSEPGWYQFEGFINGSSNGNTNTDYLIEAFSSYTYVCDCENEQEAREKLGPPPSEQGQSTPTPTRTPTPTPAATATATPAPTATAAPEQTATATATAAPQTKPTATPEPTATATPAPTATATATVTATTAPQSTATPTPAATATTTPEQRADDGGTPTATPAPRTTTAAGQQAPEQNEQRDEDLPRTPTVGAGPGFGVGAALLGVLSLFVLARRRE